MQETTEIKPQTLAVAAALVVAVVGLLVAILALGRALAAGDGTVTVDSVSGASPVAIELAEFAVTPGSVELAAGGAVLNVTNAGTAVHNLAVKDQSLTTADLNAGESATLDVSSLAAGSYTIYCTIPGHEGAGMTGTLTVGGDASSAGADAGHMDDMATAGDIQAMEALMQASIGAFPAETAGVGAAPMEPTILEDGTKLFELVVDELQWEVEPGKLVAAVGYNGMVPGPTMHADVGDRVTLRVVNNLDDEGTSLHPHGLKDHDFAIDGVTYISQDPIAPGDSMDYTFVATEEAVVTYHSHHMSLHQVPDGLFGMLVIGDWGAMSGFDNVVAEEAMILNDAGVIGLSLNGKSFPATTPYSYRQGDQVIVHYANEGQMAHPMHLHNQPGTVIAKDGYLLQPSARYQGDTFNVAPGERLTVVYEMDNVGTWVWHCHILSHVKRADGSMTGMLTAVIVEPADAQ